MVMKQDDELNNLYLWILSRADVEYWNKLRKKSIVYIFGGKTQKTQVWTAG